jgi:hypothetical protein
MPLIDLTAGAVIVLDAVDPTTGAVVTGVTFSNGILYAEGRVSDDTPLTNAQQYLLGRGS